MESLDGTPGLLDGRVAARGDSGPRFGRIRRSSARSSGGHPPLDALALRVLVLPYVPCMAAVAAQRSELGRRWMWVSLATSRTVAWVASALTFRLGLLLGLG